MTQCRFCNSELNLVFADLGSTPLANSYLPDTAEAREKEQSWPLKVMVCEECFLVQTTETVPADAIFDHDYAYLSSFSSGWLAHCKQYAEEMAARFGLNSDSKVVEVASNDGYLLQYFVQAGIPVLGVEPAGHAAELAEEKGVATRVAFFGEETAKTLVAEGHGADLMAANNVLAHVPDIRDFAKGFATLLKPAGVVTFEFPHLANLIKLNQFDTIYHEHYSYLSLLFVEKLFGEVGLEAFDVQELPTHGGSLRVFLGHKGAHEAQPGLAKVRDDEAAMGLNTPPAYANFDASVKRLCHDLKAFVETARSEGKSVAAYGAPAKGNTFLNVAGITHDLIEFTVDRNPEKQNTLLPGSHIPVLAPEEIRSRKPDYLIILPWNLRSEISEQWDEISAWGGKFVTAVPELEVS